VIYLDGNSLGARPRASLARAHEVVAMEWGQDLIKSWNKAGWFEMPKRLGDRLAPIIGARPGEVVVTDTTSLNLFKALAAALEIQRRQRAPSARSSSPSAATSRPISIWRTAWRAGSTAATRSAWSTMSTDWRPRSMPTAPC
jgi:kynureninase